MDQFFISDTHFGHANIIRYCHRDFRDEHEMNHHMIVQWNSVVRIGDIVHHGGDFAFRCHPKKLEEIIWSLNGNIHMVIGSHDKETIKLYRDGRFGTKLKIIGYDKSLRPHPPTMNIIKCGSEQITLNHYRMAKWPRSHWNAYHCFGHEHNEGIPEVGKSMNICAEVLNYTPISLDEVLEIMRNKPDNPDLIREQR